MRQTSIVMTYFNRPEQLAKTLKSFLQYDPQTFNVVIVDDGSDIPLSLPSLPFKTTVINIGKHEKFWTQGDPAYNAGIYYALSLNPEIIIIQNAECYHYGDILGFADKNLTDEIYISFGCYSQGKGEEIGQVFNEKGATADGESAWYNHPIHRPKGYHFCAAITARNMVKINGFDERLSFGAGYDDDYLLLQVSRLGLKIGITTDPIVIHQWHEHTRYPADEGELLTMNHRLFRQMASEKSYRAKHLITLDFMMKTRFYIWVTSDCTLKCPYCIQKFVMDTHKGYQMQMDEVRYIVESCKKRGLHFDMIEITGGEASLWEHLEEGVKEFEKICDMVTLATNGNNPERIKALGLKTWIVSESQALPEEMEHYRDIRHRLTINAHTHKKMPDKPIEGTLPAACCTRVSPWGEPQATFEYIKGKIYQCPDCAAHLEYVPETPDLVCSFEDDFVSKFINKTYDKEICKYCLGNGQVWARIPETTTLENYRKAARRDQ